MEPIGKLSLDPIKPNSHTSPEVANPAADGRNTALPRTQEYAMWDFARRLNMEII